MYAQIPALINEAVDNFQRGELAKARQLLEKVLGIQPRSFEALHVLGVIQALEGKQLEAIALFRKALSVNRKNNFLHFNLAKALSETGQESEALVHHKQAIKLAPNHQEAWLNFGKSLMNLGQHEEALTRFDHAIHLNPQYAEAHDNKGLVLAEMGRPEAAIACFDRAIAAKPEFADPRWNRVHQRLRLGQYADAWTDIELRWEMDKRDTPQLATARPRWQGQPSNRPLLLWGEQGLGDQVLYASILSDLAAFPQRKSLALDKRLIPLFQRSLPEFELVDLAQASDALDFAEHLPLGSLPRYFRTSLESFATARHPYLIADPLRVAALRPKIAKAGKLVCGVSWASSRKDLGSLKSIGLAELLVPLASDSLHFVNLQYGNTSSERKTLLEDHGITVQNVDEVDNLNDIDGLAALIEACDFVITTSNTTAHLSGALGKKTLLLLPSGRAIFWYWVEQGGRNPWYPVIRTFAQERPGRWLEALERLKATIENKP